MVPSPHVWAKPIKVCQRDTKKWTLPYWNRIVSYLLHQVAFSDLLWLHCSLVCRCQSGTLPVFRGFTKCFLFKTPPTPTYEHTQTGSWVWGCVIIMSGPAASPFVLIISNWLFFLNRNFLKSIFSIFNCKVCPFYDYCRPSGQSSSFYSIYPPSQQCYRSSMDLSCVPVQTESSPLGIEERADNTFYTGWARQH